MAAATSRRAAWGGNIVLTGAFTRPAAARTEDDSIDGRMVALMRCLLAFSALGIIVVDPSEPTRLVELTYLSLALYCGYSAAVLLGLLAGRALAPQRTHHWIDVGFYVCLVGFTAGTSSIFFFFFFFAILVASFSRGYGEGIAVTLVSVALFIVVGLAASPRGDEFELDRAVIRPIYLLILGYMVAYWGGHERALRQRLLLLGEVAALPNPRYGFDHTVSRGLRRLLAFFKGSCCILVRSRGSESPHVLHRVESSTPEGDSTPKPLTEAAARALLALPASASAWYCARKGRRGAAPRTLAWDTVTGERLEVPTEVFSRLANLLEVASFASVPYPQREATPGRVFLAAGPRSVTRQDVEFLGQAVAQLATSGDNLILLDELMENAAQLARSRISRDIHDTAIQPYIGLKLGLEALYKELEGSGAPGAGRLKELVDMSRLAVEDLRTYIARLRTGLPGWPGEHLLTGLKDQLERYRKYYGIEVSFLGEAQPEISDRAAAEAYQIVCEALSNIYRHTHAKRAFLELRASGDWLSISVGNQRDAGSPMRPFLPRSIAERASAAGGGAEVELNERGYDIVRVRLPLVIGYESRPRGMKVH
jgi:signal transduction histidine kinase